MAETGLLTHPASKVIVELLRTKLLGTTPSASGGTTGTSDDWPIYRANTPDDPDNVLVVFDTEGTKQGRLAEGKTVKNPGFQVLIRTNNYDIGHEKANSVFVALSEDVQNESVTIDAATYTVHAFTITSGPIPIGKETDNSKRYLFTVNGTASLRQT